jgi:hypothetical protein
MTMLHTPRTNVDIDEATNRRRPATVAKIAASGRRLTWPAGSTWPSETALQAAPNARIPRW